VQKNLTVMGLRTVMELRGVPCVPLETAAAPKKTITCSRSFGRTVESLEEMREAVAMYAGLAAEKLRAEGLAASRMEVFIHTRPHGETARYAATTSTRLALATNFTPKLVACAHRLLERIYRPGFAFSRAGVTFTHLVSEKQVQLSLFEPEGDPAREKALMAAVDALNRKFGSDTVRLASSGLKRGWGMRQEKRSKRCTTHWDELLTVAAR
jgi:DNA polymerase V